jgi:hypothetical protein
MIEDMSIRKFDADRRWPLFLRQRKDWTSGVARLAAANRWGRIGKTCERKPRLQPGKVFTGQNRLYRK